MSAFSGKWIRRRPLEKYNVIKTNILHQRLFLSFADRSKHTHTFANVSKVLSLNPLSLRRAFRHGTKRRAARQSNRRRKQCAHLRRVGGAEQHRLRGRHGKRWQLRNTQPPSQPLHRGVVGRWLFSAGNDRGHQSRPFVERQCRFKSGAIRPGPRPSATSSRKNALAPKHCRSRPSA